MIFLPGSDIQINALFRNIDQKFSSILIIGSGCEDISIKLQSKFSCPITIIVENYDSLINTRVSLANIKDVSVRMMDFTNTDFTDSSFDLVYAQASISNNNRNKIIKEIKRILKPEGYFCNGEIVRLKDPIPVFVNDIWKASDINTININAFDGFYKDKGFEIIHDEDISGSLKEFYLMGNQLLKEKSGKLTDEEKSYYKKLLKQISHESNVYLKLGGDKFIGFKILIMKKGQL